MQRRVLTGRRCRPGHDRTRELRRTPRPLLLRRIDHPTDSDEGIVVSPTVFIALQTAKQFQVRGTAHNPQDVAAIERLTGRLDNARRFHELGMKIIGGTDCGAADTPFNSIVDEILTYTQAGMSNAEALRSITSNGASYMNLDGVGQVAEGFRADLLLLREDPLGNLDALKTPAKVFKSGRLEYED